METEENTPEKAEFDPSSQILRLSYVARRIVFNFVLYPPLPCILCDAERRIKTGFRRQLLCTSTTFDVCSSTKRRAAPRRAAPRTWTAIVTGVPALVFFFLRLFSSVCFHVRSSRKPSTHSRYSPSSFSYSSPARCLTHSAFNVSSSLFASAHCVLDPPLLPLLSALRLSFCLCCSFVSVFGLSLSDVSCSAFK